MPEVVHMCPVCGSREYSTDGSAARVLRLGRPFGVVRCDACAMRWLSPRPTAGEYAALYRAAYFGGHARGSPAWLGEYPLPNDSTRRFAPEHADSTRQHSLAQLKILAQRKPDRGRLLEIGAGYGEFLSLARAQGWQVSGIEPNEDACREAQHRHGLTLLPIALEDYSTDERWDAVYASHVLEHLPDPGRAVRQMGALLAPGGILMVEVPNQFESWLSTIKRHVPASGSRLRSLYSIHHTMFFGPGQLRELLRSQGFDASLVSHLQRGQSRGLRHKVQNLVDRLAAATSHQGSLLLAVAAKE